MTSVTSKDGTRIAYEVVGDGPPVLLVDGAFCSRSFGPMRPLSRELSSEFSVYLYDRRGRGYSADGATYDVRREIDDIAAIADAAGAEMNIYGTSSGAVLTARAVGAGVPTRKMALYEPPLALDGTHYPDPPDFRERIRAMLADDRRGDAVKLFMRVVGVPRFGIFAMQMMRGTFAQLKEAAPTLLHDFEVLGDTQRGGPLPEELHEALGAIDVPALVMVGSKSPPWMGHAVKTVSEAIEGAKMVTVPKQDHNASAKAIAPLLRDFFS